MQINTDALVTKKEKMYFRILLGANISFWVGSFLCLFGPFKLPIIFIYLYFLFTFLLALLGQGLFMGYLKNSAIKVSEKQLPGVLRTVKNLSAKIGLEKIPDIFIIESGGLLNAFATKFLLGSRNFVFIYSDILELAFEKGEGAIEFVISHELAHLKRNHLNKRLFSFAVPIPLLDLAYYRACEYTCDAIAKAATSRESALHGLSVFGIGKKLFATLDIDELTSNGYKERDIWSFLAEKLSTHPPIFKRLEALNKETQKSPSYSF